MFRTTRALSRSLVVVLLLTITAAGCEKTSSGPAKLDGAVSAIPVLVPSSEAGERSSGFTSDDVGSPTKFSTYTWHLETSKSVADVEAFYRAQWPAGGRTEDDSEITLRNPPLPEEEAPLGESLMVTIYKAQQTGKTRFDVTEDVFSERRP